MCSIPFKILLHTLLLALTPLSVTASSVITGKVIGVSGGDTIKLLFGRRRVKVRLYGIDCPETGQDFGKRVKRATSTLAFKTLARVITNGKDRYGRTIGDVYVGSTHVNHELVKQGICWWYRKYAPADTTLKSLEKEARDSRRALRAGPHAQPPWEYRSGKVKSGRRGMGPAKLSRNNICHAPGTKYCNRVKRFKPYNSLENCLKCGRLPKW